MAINSLSASSYGLSGLVSGMNTQEMVEKMLSGTTSKITAQQQKKAQLEYKQEIYRGLATQLRTLQNSFFSFSNPTQNLMSSAFFSSMKASTESKYFHANATSSASSGLTNVDYITQLAKAAKLTSSKKASGELITNTGTDTGEKIFDKLKAFKEGIKTKVKFSLDGEGGVVSETLTEADLLELAGKSDDEVAAKLNEIFTEKNFAMRVSSENGKLMFKAADPNHKVMISTDATGKAFLGLGSTAVNGKGSYSTSIDTKQFLPSIQVQLDNGEKKTVYFDPKITTEMENDHDAQVTALTTALQEGFKKTFGSDAIKVSKVDQTLADGSPAPAQIKFDVTDKSRTFVITGGSAAMDILGLTSGQSNKMTTGMRLDQINFKDKLAGNDFRFSINGEEFHVTGDTTLSSLMSIINSSDAGVKLTYNPNNDLFSLESTVSGSGSEITMEQHEGNLLTTLFGVKGNTAVSGKTMTNTDEIKATSVKDLKSRGGSVSFDVVSADGVRRTISLSINAPEASDRYFTNKQEFIDGLNEGLKQNDDYQKLGVQMEFKLASDGTVSLVTDPNTKVFLKATKGSVLEELGFSSGQTNAATLETTLKEAGLITDGNPITVGGQTLNEDSTLEALKTALQQELGTDETTRLGTVVWDESASKFRITGVDNSITDTPTSNIRTISISAGAKKIFGLSDSEELTFEKATTTSELDHMITDGQNAKLSIGGNEIERSSNDFTYDGITFSLTQTFDGRVKDEHGYGNLLSSDNPNHYAVDENGLYRTMDGEYVLNNGHTTPTYDPDNAANYKVVDGTEVYQYNDRAGQVDVTRDTEQIYNGIVKFVDEYNKVMENIHSLLVEDPDYKDYLPLTDEQKSAMSDREIELWEEKSKTGLLRGDSTLNAIWEDLRSTIYKKPAGSDIAIYNLGITTSGSTEYGGQLVINHSKLQEAIAANPEEIRKMFTDSVDGVATMLNDAINRAAKNSTASPGRLVAMAGSSKSDTSSSLYKQMKAIDDNLKTLKNRYDSEYTRYWKQFNAMEQMIQNMNQQSSWLSQQFSS